MKKLIKLEFKKHKLFGYVKGAFIANLIVLAFMTFIYFVEKVDDEDPSELIFYSYEYVFQFLLSISTSIFLIFGAVVLARLVIEEYRSKTITLLFTYPLSRKKLLSAKLLIVSAFIFGSILFTNLFVGSVVYVVDLFVDIIPSELLMEQLTNALILVLTNGIAVAGIGLVPLYFGMRNKSVPSTIVSAIIVLSILSSFVSYDLSVQYFISMGVLAVLGVIIAYLSFRNIEHEDVVI